MQQDKTDWYWNGVLAGAVNNLYYDFINVDVVHVPYTTTHRNSSFFLQTRRSYAASDKRTADVYQWHRDWDVVDVKHLWDENCSKEEGTVYALLANKWRNKVRIHRAKIEDWCVQRFDWNRERWREFTVTWCWDFKLFVTDYIKWKRILPSEAKAETWEGTPEAYTGYDWIQINRYEWWKTYWYFSDTNVVNWTEKFILYWEWEWEESEHWVSIWDYLLVYDVDQPDVDWRWFPWQVRMIIWIEDGELVLDEAWQWFKTLTWESDSKKVVWEWVAYYIFKDWWEVVWFTNWRNIYIANDYDEPPVSVYKQDWLLNTNIISVADSTGKVYILTDNWYIHFSTYSWYDKFFINDSNMFAGSDKTSIVSYRDILIAFGSKNLAVGIPDENNERLNIYRQSATVWLWSRYSYAEYDWDMIFVSNDKRLLALWIANNSWKYMLQYEDVWDMINSKLSVLTLWDEVFVWSDNNDLRVFVQTKSMPFYNDDWDWQAHFTDPSYVFDGSWTKKENKYQQENSMTRIIKFDKLFKVWTEDWIQWILLQWIEWWIYFWQNGLYQRARWSKDYKGDNIWNNWSWYWYGFKSYISAYLIENESDWVWGTNSWLANRAKLYNVAKLNRLITTLWPWIYSHDTKIRITSYVKWLWRVYEFSVDWWNNDWLWLITTKYLWESLDAKEIEKLECLNSVLQDSQKAYQPKCTWIPNAAIQNSVQQQPWCDTYTELLTWDRWVCIDDSLYELAPTMPLTTDLWENQDYSTQIKLELIWWEWDIITFGGWLWEMFIAPLFTKGPDWEYQLQPNTDC